MPACLILEGILMCLNFHSQDDFEDLLSEDDGFNGAFSFSKTYQDAPNPGLRLADLGTVGLPLSTREAEAVKMRCALAPFGKGERTLVDKTVRDTWEMDAPEVCLILIGLQA